jgi:hypothetical protein
MNFRIVIAAACLAAAPAAFAADLGDGKTSLHFTGGWIYGVTNTNAYDAASYIADPQGQLENGEINLAVLSRVLPNVTVGAQLAFDEDPSGQSMGLDWAFAEYTFNDLFKLRAGKVKMPFGLFGEIEAIGTLRPFYGLPNSVYGRSTVSAVGYYGAGLTGSLSSGNWTFQYDLYGGEAHTETVQPFLRAKAQLTAGTLTETQEEDLRQLVGGRLTLLTPIDGLQVRVSAFRADLDDAALFTAMLSAEYQDELWGARVEAYRASERFLTFGGYAELSRFLTQSLQVAVRAEVLHTQADSAGIPSDSQFLRHREGAVGLNYWLSQQVVFKLAFHFIDGNRLVFPTALDDALLAGGVQQQTRMFTAGTQFTF